MPKKDDQRLADIRARVARRATAAPPPSASENQPSDPTPAPPPADALAAAHAHFLGSAEALLKQAVITALPVGQIAPDLRPEMRQARLLPPPEELLVQGEPAPAYRALVDELLQLGQSLREQQIQPIVVYPGSSAQYPAADYLVLVGHRRWTAAVLQGLATLDALIIDVPSAVDRVRMQYTENEAREEFSDMERAWALTQMKRALDDAPWEAIETQFGISRSRRHELTRMLAFTATQQQQVALLRLQETQVRSLHSALRNKELSSAQVDAILFRLEQIAAERGAAYSAAARADGDPGPPRRVRIDGPTIARLVARAQRTGSPRAMVSATPAPRWIAPLREQILHTQQGIQRAVKRADTLGSPESDGLIADLSQLVASITDLIQALNGTSDSDTSTPRSDQDDHHV